MDYLNPNYILAVLVWGAWFAAICVFALALDEGMWAAYKSTRGFRRIVATFMLLFAVLIVMAFGLLIWRATLGGYK